MLDLLNKPIGDMTIFEFVLVMFLLQIILTVVSALLAKFFG